MAATLVAMTATVARLELMIQALNNNFQPILLLSIVFMKRLGFWSITKEQMSFLSIRLQGDTYLLNPL